ncbi:CBL-interacting serine/threonine-protein kinase 5 [Cimex lectularius]|uniref:non-specific serine/threonine protein kinase n=1 Tax=Cimex lectularius TaxID=79782 RepID=A0A8I6R8J0_CIMLE|nr:CBL-interacting serine/threonine-protein kinase 5 [Cimex lectularius]
MRDYKIICMIGEGSFGRVYKARRKDNYETVAMKLIGKYGKSTKELTGLRTECEIQQHLNHPNIIRMIESFETDNEIVVITEFAYQDLYVLLSIEGYLHEDKAKKIIFDLISALYYLHSNRVLHRDLKPQNVLLCKNGTAKLCDFGFARNMSLSTHLLTSIKGTPLYMAPELMEESPYDHTADLWSLGCIAYEILVGTPPFTTTSILHLARLIRFEPVKLPEFTSPECQSLLKGLLIKDPSQRLKWPQLLEHPFVKGNILIIYEKGAKTPLTAEFTSSQVKAKELQKQDLKSSKHLKQLLDKCGNQIKPGSNFGIGQIVKNINYGIDDIEQQVQKLNISKVQKEDNKLEEELKEALNYGNNDSPLQSEEWLVFLQKSMEEVMEGDIQSVKDPAFLNMVCRALSSSCATVVEYIASLFCMPFTVDSIPEKELQNLRMVYYEARLISKMIFACVIILKRVDKSNDLSSEHLQALETIYLLITNLVHTDVCFLKQFCETCTSLCVSSHLVYLLCLKKKKVRLVANIISILCQILRKLKEYSHIITDIVKGFESPDVEFQAMLTLNTECLSMRTLALIKLMLEVCPDTLELLCPESLEKDLESLIKSSKESINSMAAEVLEDLQKCSQNQKMWLGES